MDMERHLVEKVPNDRLHATGQKGLGSLLHRRCSSMHSGSSSPRMHAAAECTPSSMRYSGPKASWMVCQAAQPGGVLLQLSQAAAQGCQVLHSRC